MKKTLIASTILLFGFFATAQNPVTLQHLGTASFYTTIDLAYAASVTGDTIYLPGGIFTTPTTWTINRKLHIYGVGHYPDSTTATGATQYNGTIKFITGSSGSLLSGVYVNGSIYVGSVLGDQVIDGLTISRCNVNSTIYLSYNGTTATTGQNFHIEENLAYNLYCGYAKNVYIERNIISGSVSYLNGNGINTIRNNIFLANYYPFASSSVSFTNIENNIFLCSSYDPSNGVSSSTFNNNLFVYNLTNWQTNTQSNNFVNQAQSSIFVAQSGYSFNYAHNYHLKAGCAGIGTGTDATDMGIYGTSTPYKNGAVPAHPHIRQQIIAPTTDGSGNLNISIKVGAQDR